ncbi:MAG: hypothetical protein GXP31_04270 [Kiritimatiellaeota bacterium]|nr:hypothetical protein [Kiritimatiellota bacterium]
MKSEKPADVILLAGQSNATGQGYVRNLPPGETPDARVMLFHSRRIVSGKTPLAWHPLLPASEDPDRFGPELGFGNRLAALEPERTIAVIKHAASGSNLYRDWAPGAGPGDTQGMGPDFAEFAATVEAGLRALREQGFAPTIRAMLWQQGEADASEKAGIENARAYAERLGHFIARCREQFHAPWMFFCYGMVLPRPTGFAGREIVRNAQRAVAQESGAPEAVPGALLVETDDLSLRRDDPGTPYPSDTVHFGTAGMLHLGMRMADRIHWERVRLGELADDPALDPPPVYRPPPARYADDRRLFQGIPGLARAPRGRLWATWYSGGTAEGPENFVAVATSADDGETWSPIRLVIDPPGNVRAFDPCLWLAPTGNLWLFWAQSRSWYDGRAGVWAMVTDNPDAPEPVWTAPRRLCHGIMMNKPLVTRAGVWLLPAALWDTSNGMYPELDPLRRANVVASWDRGVSWHFLGGAHIPGKRDCDEHMLVECRDGALRMFIRTRFGIAESVSRDGGRQWTEAAPSNIAHVTSRFFIRELRSGCWLLVKHGALDARGERSHLTAYVSDDEGRTWRGGLLLDERPGISYPDGVEGPDGTILIIYDHSRTGAKEILLAAFTEADAVAGRDVSGRVRLRRVVNKATGTNLPDPSTFRYRENRDGAPLLEGAGAEFALPREGVVRPFRAGERIFTNRAYTVHAVPEVLGNRRFLRGSIDRTELECTRDGIVYVLTPLPDRNRDSVQAELERQGFVKAAVPEFLLMWLPNGEANLVSVFQAHMRAGDVLRFGKWGAVVFLPE